MLGLYYSVFCDYKILLLSILLLYSRLAILKNSNSKNAEDTEDGNDYVNLFNLQFEATQTDRSILHHNSSQIVVTIIKTCTVKVNRKKHFPFFMLIDKTPYAGLR